MAISLKRVYEEPSATDGCRILVDRLWPRGLTKENARVDLWVKGIAPSSDLRKWYNHDPDRWNEFRKRYFKELDGRPEEMDSIRERLAAGRVTFVFSSREERLNNAAALKEYLERSG